MCFSASKNGVVASTGVSEASGVSPVDWDGLHFYPFLTPPLCIYNIWIYLDICFIFIWIYLDTCASGAIYEHAFKSIFYTFKNRKPNSFTSMNIHGKPPYGSKHFLRRSFIHPPNQSPKKYMKILPEKATAGSQPGPEHPAIFSQASRRASGDAAAPSCPPGNMAIWPGRICDSHGI